MKKIGGDKETSTFQHDAGHKITVYHKALPALQRKQLEKLAIQMAEGGDVADLKAKDKDPYQAAGQTIAKKVDPEKAKQLNGSFGTLAHADGGEIKMYAEGTPEAPVDPSALESLDPKPKEEAPIFAPTKTEAPQIKMPAAGTPENINASLALGQKGIQQQAAVSAQLAKSKADIDQQDLQARQAIDKNVADNTAMFDSHRKELLDLYKNQEINPNHYMENMSTPRKVATAIGLFLGGWGKNGNPAQEFLNAQINRDIEGQRARADKSKTLLGENEKYFQDKQLGYNAARMAQNDIYAHMIQKAADKIGTPQAEANKNMALSQFAIQNNALAQQSAYRKTLMDHLGSGSGGQGTSALMFSDAGYLKPEEAQKEQAAIDAGKNATQQVRDIYSNLAKQQTLSNRISHPIESGESIAALNAQLDNIVLGADVAKRLSPEVIKHQLEPFHVSLKDNAEGIAEKAQGVMNLIKQSHAGLTPFMTQNAPKALPDYSIKAHNPLEGQTASGPNGEKLVNKNGQWVNMNPAAKTESLVSGR